MAECSEDELSTLFASAADYLVTLVPSLDQNQLLEFYGLYKQATIGKCNTSQPGWFAFEAKRKWEAWNSLGAMSQEDAMRNYIDLLTEIKPDWDKEYTSGGDGFAVVSRFASEEEALDDSEKDIFDWVKEGNVEEVKRSVGTFEIEVRDEEDMGLLHWASDRGNLEMVKFLVGLNADVNAIDGSGQTPLHYASACEHLQVVDFLLSQGANPNVKCYDGNFPSDITTDSNVKQSLQQSLAS